MASSTINNHNNGGRHFEETDYLLPITTSKDRVKQHEDAEQRDEQEASRSREKCRLLHDHTTTSKNQAFGGSSLVGFIVALLLGGALVLVFWEAVSAVSAVPHRLRHTLTNLSRTNIGAAIAPARQQQQTSLQQAHDWWKKESDVPTSDVTLDTNGAADNALIDNNGSNKRRRTLRWGILGLGRIAQDFCTALKMAGANVTAVAAGSLPHAESRARIFASVYAIPYFYGSYQELANDDTVDIVYIATTNQLHYNNTMLMLRAGKNVLVEKPMAMNMHEAQAMADEAKSQHRLLLTNYWTRFFPVVKHTRSIALLSSRPVSNSISHPIEDEKKRLPPQIGVIASMHGDFSFPAPPDPSSRLLNRTLGGGAMLDLGCYLVNIAVMMMKTTEANSSSSLYPVDIQATAQTSYEGVEYGVDTEISFSLRWGGSLTTNNRRCAATDDDTLNDLERIVRNHSQPATNDLTMIVSGQASFRRPSSFEVEVGATQGRIVIHGPANAANASTLYEYEPYGPLRRIEYVRSRIPEFDERYGPQQYPRGGGFCFIIQELERCMSDKGIPGRVGDEKNVAGCLELGDLTMDEQLLTVKITEEVMRKAGYWRHQPHNED